MTKQSELLSKLEDRLRSQFGDKLESVEIIKHRFIRIKLDREHLIRLCTTLRDEFDFEQLTSISAVDYKKYFQIVYHISSFSNIYL